MNQCNFIGRLGKDAEITYTPSGMAVTKFSIAVDRKGKEKNGEKKEAMWLNVVIFDKTAEAITKFLVKGKRVGVSGTIDVRSYKDRNTDEWKSWTELIGNNVDLLDGGDRESNGATPNRDEQAQAPAPGQNSGPITEEDIPF